MRHLCLMLISVLIVNYAGAQKTLAYPDLYSFNGKPAQAKIFVHSQDESKPPHYFFVIVYDYDKQIRTFTKYTIRNGDTALWEHGEPLVQSILPEDMAHEYVTGMAYPFHHTVDKYQMQATEDGDTKIVNGDNSNIYKKDEQGRLIEEIRYIKGELNFVLQYDYPEAGKIIRKVITNDGRLRSRSKIAQTPYGEPMIITYETFENKELGITANSSVSVFEYKYDKHQNFTKCVELFEGGKNFIITREITYE